MSTQSQGEAAPITSDATIEQSRPNLLTLTDDAPSCCGGSCHTN